MFIFLSLFHRHTKFCLAILFRHLQTMKNHVSPVQATALYPCSASTLLKVFIWYFHPFQCLRPFMAFGISASFLLHAACYFIVPLPAVRREGRRNKRRGKSHRRPLPGAALKMRKGREGRGGGRAWGRGGVSSVCVRGWNC